MTEVFYHMNLLDLCAVAEVCNRFKQNAQVCFALSQKTNLVLMKDVQSAGDTPNQILSKTLKVLRNFGKSVVAFTEQNDEQFYIETHTELWQIIRRKIIELLIRYSSGNLTELGIVQFNSTDDIAPTVRPLIERLHKFQLLNCTIRETSLGMRILLLRASELRELRIETIHGGQFDCLHRPFPALVKVVLKAIDNLNSDDITEMLKYNPQLKQIELSYNKGVNTLDSTGNILPSIAKHVRGIESPNISLMPRRSPLNRLNVNYFGQLSKLRSLSLVVLFRCEDTDYIVSEICAISLVNIALKHLVLKNLEVGRVRCLADKFLNYIPTS